MVFKNTIASVSIESSPRLFKFIESSFLKGQNSSLGTQFAISVDWLCLQGIECKLAEWLFTCYQYLFTSLAHAVKIGIKAFWRNPGIHFGFYAPGEEKRTTTIWLVGKQLSERYKMSIDWHRRCWQSLMPLFLLSQSAVTYRCRRILWPGISRALFPSDGFAHVMAPHRWGYERWLDWYRTARVMALHLNYDMRRHGIVEGEGLKDTVTVYTRWGFSKARQCVQCSGWRIMAVSNYFLYI